MFPLAEPRRWRAVPYLGTAVLVAAGIAGCTSDVSRFNDSPLASPYAARNAAPAPDVTGTVSHPPPAATRVETQPLPPPPQASAEGGSTANSAQGRADITGSVHPTAAAPARSSWNWEGGTAITVGHGDTIEQLSKRYGVPASAIMQANNITAPASIQPGQRLVIPRYNYYSGVQNSRAPATRVAANATMVPVGATKPQAALPAPPRAGNGVHVVVQGDSLISIARRYHKPRKAIAKANNLALDARIRVGQRLTIPDMKPSAPASPAPVANPTAKAPPAGPAPRRTADVVPAPKPAPPPASAAPGTKVVAGSAGANIRVAAPAAEPGVDAPAGTASAETAGSNPTFRWPVRGRIITGFGPRTNGQQNDGINLSVPEGTSVKAAEDGVVAYAGNELKGYGNLILVRHGNGFVTAYAHASELMVKRGDQVKRGQIIMRSGQSGSVTSPQLHFEIRKGASPVDPTQFLSGT